MCKNKLKWEKVLKLILEIKFYETVMYVFLVGIGYQTLSVNNLFRLIFSISLNINHSFVGSFVILYLFIPFYNKLIDVMSQVDYKRLLLLMLSVCTIVGTFLGNFEVFSHITWYTVLYFLAAYVRKYPGWWTENKKFTRSGFWLFFVLSNLSIVTISVLDSKMNLSINSYYFVMNSNKILALLVSLFIFLWFKNMNIGYSKVINLVGATTFGVLLIHTNSEAFSKLLWVDLLHTPQMFSYNTGILLVHFILSTLGVFCVCMFIDLLRSIVIEEPIFKLIGEHRERIENKYLNMHKTTMQRILGFSNWLEKVFTKIR